jgi:hypothetical protein
MRSFFTTLARKSIGVCGLPPVVLANADQDTATACSNSLSADGKLVYGKVAPSVTPKTDLKEALTSWPAPQKRCAHPLAVRPEP